MELLLLVLGLSLLKRNQGVQTDGIKPPPPDIDPRDQRGGIIYTPRVDPNAGSGGGSKPSVDGGQRKIML